MSNQVTPKSIQAGIPRLTKPRAGYRQVKLGDILYEEKRPIKMLDSKQYRLVTVKRSRGGIEERSKLLGKAISVKSQFKIAENDFLISKRQIVHGACVLVPKEFEGSIVSNEYAVLRARPELDIRYLKYLSHSVYFQQTCFHSSIGVHVEKMIFKLADWFNWSVNLPELEEQQKIANFLTSVDTKIQQLKHKRTLTQQYKKGVMQQLFSQQVRFKDGDGRDYPEWEKKRLGAVVDYLQPTKYLVENTEYDDSYQTPVLTAGKTFILGYTNETEDVFNNGLPVIIFDDFTTAFKYVDFNFKAKSSAMKILVPKSNVNTKFVYESMGQIRFPIGEHKRYWISEFQYEKIAYPCVEEQQKIVDYLCAIDSKILNIKTQITQTETFKKGLLQQMFL